MPYKNETKTPPQNEGLMASLYARMNEAGFPLSFVRRVVLPSWWDDSLAQTETGFSHAAILVSRHTGVDIATLFNPNVSVALKTLGEVKFKANVVAEALRVATSVAFRTARLVLKAAKALAEDSVPTSAADLRKVLESRGNQVVVLDTLLEWCWSVGIPVLHLNGLPGKKPQALCLKINSRYVIFLCENKEWNAWQAFHLAHEIGHICLGHLSGSDSLYVDETINLDDTDKQEREANDFAVELLLGAADAAFSARPNIKAADLAQAAKLHGVKHKLDPQALVLNIFWHDLKNSSTVGNRIARNISAVKILQAGVPSAMERIAVVAKSKLDLNCLDLDDREFLFSIAGWNQAREKDKIK